MSDIETELAAVLRDERMRQYREQDRAKWPGGIYDFEEHQGPWLEARAALAFLKERGMLNVLHIGPAVLHTESGDHVTNGVTVIKVQD